MLGGVSSGLVVVAAAMMCAATPRSAETGRVQVAVPEGARVEVSGRAATDDGRGLAVVEVPAGAHVLVASRPGFRPQRSVLEVQGGEVTVHALAPWEPSREGGARNATVVIRTVPADATVAAPTLGIPKTTKGPAPLVLPRVPAGHHRLTFCTYYKCIDYRAEVGEDDVLSLVVDFDPGEVRDESDAFSAQLAALTDACAAGENPAVCSQACSASSRVDVPSPACAPQAELQLAKEAGPVSEQPEAIPVSAGRTLP